jgi:PhnB protein
MMMTHGQAPDPSSVRPELKDAILHARMSIGDTELMGADIPGCAADAQRVSVAERRQRCGGRAHFSAFLRRGEIFIPMQETFFATRFAQLRDRFGINWMIMRERRCRHARRRRRHKSGSAIANLSTADFRGITMRTCRAAASKPSKRFARTLSDVEVTTAWASRR